MRRILPIVEGDGDMLAVPELIRRVAADQGVHDVKVMRPHKRGELPKVLSRFDDYLATALLEQAPLLWVMDYDCADCTDRAGHVRELRKRATRLAPSVPVEFVFMVQEFETLFLADPETTRFVFKDIPATTAFPEDPERVRNAKGWLSQVRPKGSAYKPTQHQQKLAALIDLARLRSRSPSFVQFETAVSSLLAH
jgi:Domain of unknown function (DUF4276)